MNVDVVIGANFGDEGKGAVTNSLCKEHKDETKLNVLFNGGCQRGHNVKDRIIEHTFHCFGSGYYSGADTYYEKDFMIDPFGYAAEANVLSSFPIQVIAHPECQIVFVMDKAVNRAVEELRNNRHGSCGMGIYETWNRVNNGCSCTVLDCGVFDLAKLLKDVSAYYRDVRIPEVAKELHVPEEKVLGKINEVLTRDGDCDISAWVYCMKSFYKNCDISANPYKYYDYVIFEGGQGLALDMDNKKYWPHLTPSHTGLANLVRPLKNLGCTYQVNYISRPYYTRHGAGTLRNEMKASELPFALSEDINVPNSYQGTLRYAPLDSEILKRIENDKHYAGDVGLPFISRIVMTHLDETDGKIFYKNNQTKSEPHFISLDKAKTFMGRIDPFNP